MLETLFTHHIKSAVNPSICCQKDLIEDAERMISFILWGGRVKLKSGTLIGGTMAGNAKILPHPIYPSIPYEWGSRWVHGEKALLY